MHKQITRYLHGTSDELSDLWEYDAPQQDVFGYALYEVKVTLDVDLETGKSWIIAVDDVPLEKPTPA